MGVIASHTSIPQLAALPRAFRSTFVFLRQALERIMMGKKGAQIKVYNLEGESVSVDSLLINKIAEFATKTGMRKVVEAWADEYVQNLNLSFLPNKFELLESFKMLSHLEIYKPLLKDLNGKLKKEKSLSGIDLLEIVDGKAYKKIRSELFKKKILDSIHQVKQDLAELDKIKLDKEGQEKYEARKKNVLATITDIKKLIAKFKGDLPSHEFAAKYYQIITKHNNKRLADPVRELMKGQLFQDLIATIPDLDYTSIDSKIRNDEISIILNAVTNENYEGLYTGMCSRHVKFGIALAKFLKGSAEQIQPLLNKQGVKAKIGSFILELQILKAKISKETRAKLDLPVDPDEFPQLIEALRGFTDEDLVEQLRQETSKPVNKESLDTKKIDNLLYGYDPLVKILGEAISGFNIKNTPFVIFEKMRQDKFRMEMSKICGENFFAAMSELPEDEFRAKMSKTFRKDFLKEISKLPEDEFRASVFKKIAEDFLKEVPTLPQLPLELFKFSAFQDADASWNEFIGKLDTLIRVSDDCKESFDQMWENKNFRRLFREIVHDKAFDPGCESDAATYALHMAHGKRLNRTDKSLNYVRSKFFAGAVYDTPTHGAATSFRMDNEKNVGKIEYDPNKFYPSMLSRFQAKMRYLGTVHKVMAPHYVDTKTGAVVPPAEKEITFKQGLAQFTAFTSLPDSKIETVSATKNAVASKEIKDRANKERLEWVKYFLEFASDSAKLKKALSASPVLTDEKLKEIQQKSLSMTLDAGGFKEIVLKSLAISSLVRTFLAPTLSDDQWNEIGRRLSAPGLSDKELKELKEILRKALTPVISDEQLKEMRRKSLVHALHLAIDLDSKDALLADIFDQFKSANWGKLKFADVGPHLPFIVNCSKLNVLDTVLTLCANPDYMDGEELELLLRDAYFHALGRSEELKVKHASLESITKILERIEKVAAEKQITLKRPRFSDEHGGKASSDSSSNNNTSGNPGSPETAKSKKSKSESKSKSKSVKSGSGSKSEEKSSELSSASLTGSLTSKFSQSSSSLFSQPAALTEALNSFIKDGQNEMILQVAIEKGIKDDVEKVINTFVICFHATFDANDQPNLMKILRWLESNHKETFAKLQTRAQGAAKEVFKLLLVKAESQAESAFLAPTT